MDSTEHYYLKAREVAARLRIHPSQVYRLIEKGELPAVRIGEKSVRVPAGGLEAYLRARASQGKIQPVRVQYTQLPAERAKLIEVARAFEQRTGRDAFGFVRAWRKGEVEDTAANADLAIEALSLRSALQEAGLVPQAA